MRLHAPTAELGEGHRFHLASADHRRDARRASSNAEGATIERVEPASPPPDAGALRAASRRTVVRLFADEIKKQPARPGLRYLPSQRAGLQVAALKNSRFTRLKKPAIETSATSVLMRASRAAAARGHEDWEHIDSVADELRRVIRPPGARSRAAASRTDVGRR